MGEARARAAPRFLRQLMASLLAGVAWPSLPTVPQFALLGWAMLPAPLEGNELYVSPAFACELRNSFPKESTRQEVASLPRSPCLR